MGDDPVPVKAPKHVVGKYDPDYIKYGFLMDVKSCHSPVQFFHFWSHVMFFSHLFGKMVLGNISEVSSSCFTVFSNHFLFISYLQSYVCVFINLRRISNSILTTVTTIISIIQSESSEQYMIRVSNSDHVWFQKVYSI